ncbi:MAG: hypothetical protein COA58_00825 [Bacteroidetes bacterium]|nr:MAG: hypothetical protein COA58_00825 [Bacteroidota bacterium]
MILAFSLFSGCDNDEPIPSYIHIPRIDVTTDLLTQGSNAHEIVDAWVYINNQLVGAFELPATIPILTSGKQKLTIIGGIKKNGFVTQRIAYPFFKPFEVEREFIPSQVDTIFPVMSYNDNTKFPWLENFEDQTISMTKSGSNTTYDSMVITGLESDVYDYDGIDNKFSGKVAIPQGLQIFENSTVGRYDLPRSGQEIYLEINFKCNTEFVVGIYPINGSVIQGVPILNLRSTLDESTGNLKWKKTYISLKEDVNVAENIGADFKIFFNAQTNTTTGTPLIYFDNIKLVHF